MSVFESMCERERAGEKRERARQRQRGRKRERVKQSERIKKRKLLGKDWSKKRINSRSNKSCTQRGILSIAKIDY